MAARETNSRREGFRHRHQAQQCRKCPSRAHDSAPNPSEVTATRSVSVLPLRLPPGHTTSWLTSISQSLWPSPPLHSLCLPAPLSLLIPLPRCHAQPFAQPRQPPPRPPTSRRHPSFNSPAGCFPLIFPASSLARIHARAPLAVSTSSACSRIGFHHFILSASVSP